VSPEQPILVGPIKNKKNVSGATKNTKISILGWKIYFWLLSINFGCITNVKKRNNKNERKT
jgi:hypothetical protein